MSEEKAVYFPTGNRGADDLKDGYDLLRCVTAALAAMQDNLVEVDIDALRTTADHSANFLAGALAWAVVADNEQVKRENAQAEAEAAERRPGPRKAVPA